MEAIAACQFASRNRFHADEEDGGLRSLFSENTARALALAASVIRS